MKLLKFIAIINSFYSGVSDIMPRNSLTEYCESSKPQFCRMMCPDPNCEKNQCAMRTNECCEYTCSENNGCQQECPPPIPCPAPPSNCEYTPPQTDNCGCIHSCGTIDCSMSTSLEGETCGGYMPPGMTRSCINGLECVYTMGPYIADAPGTCQTRCLTFRDNWGNCVERGCRSWYDGCNTCVVQDGNNLQQCTEEMCYRTSNVARCIDGEENIDGLITEPVIPHNCLTWYDGCNTCSVNNGEIGGCTLMMCFTNNEPYCMTFQKGDLVLGDMCYRFCEDNSQTSINRMTDCPLGTECSSLLTRNQVSMISYDSCGNRAYTCNLITGH